MQESKPIDSKDVGLAIGLSIGRHFLNTEDLHYGYWPPELAWTLPNLRTAQERYSQFLLEHFPQGVKTVLDVGSGSGNFSRKLLAKGYTVDCVSPSLYLTQRINENLKDSVEVYPCKFEDLDTSKAYDLVLFSESFQYVDPKTSLNKALALLPFGGHVLISDFFRRDGVPGESPLGGGHSYNEFVDLLGTLPFEVKEELDITKQTAPTMEVFGEVLNDVARPIRNYVTDLVQFRHPMLSKFLAWKFEKRFKKLDKKYFSGALNGKSFAEFKTYRVFLLRKTALS